MKKNLVNILVISLASIFSLAMGVHAATTIASSSVTYGDTTVQAALDELIEKTTPLSSKVKIGDYVSMTPTKTTYLVPYTLTGNRTVRIRPQKLNLWRVIDIRSDGTVDMVSEYVGSEMIYFYGQTGFLNLVGTLNLIASQYENSKYTVGSRHMGYNGQTDFIIETDSFNPTTAPWTEPTSNNDNESSGGGDIMYQTDTELVNKALGTLAAYTVGTTTPQSYWLASRRYYYLNNNIAYGWGGRYVYADGTIDYYDGMYGDLYGHSIDNTLDPLSRNNGFRPIVTLRPEITSYSGSGTSASPWVLS